MVSKSTDLAMALLRKAELDLNKKKLEILVFRGSGLSNNNTEITFIAGKTIVSKSKYLGVYVDTKLTFKEHYHYLYEKCTKLIPKLIAICQRTWGYSNSARSVMFQGTVRAV